jgi:hypothetical protein
MSSTSYGIAKIAFLILLQPSIFEKKYKFFQERVYLLLISSLLVIEDEEQCICVKFLEKGRIIKERRSTLGIVTGRWKAAARLIIFRSSNNEC